MSVLVDETSRIIVQGITGKEGKFHTYQCMDYAQTNVVGGVTPGKGGTQLTEVPPNKKPVPIFNTVRDAVREEGANVSIIFVPPPLPLMQFWNHWMLEFKSLSPSRKEFRSMTWFR